MDLVVPECPARFGHQGKSPSSIAIGHILNPFEQKTSIIQGNWGIIRRVGISGIKIQYLNLDEPTPIWVNTPNITTSREIVLTALGMLIRSSPRFTEVK